MQLQVKTLLEVTNKLKICQFEKLRISENSTNNIDPYIPHFTLYIL